MTDVLSVRGLKKVIGKKTLVENISFDIKEGEVFGFLGPNGAGKTTTIRMLVGLIKPTEGSITACGFNVQTQFQRAMRQIGSIVENPELYTYLTGWENLKQFSRMLGGIPDERIMEIVKMVHLDPRIHDKVKKYSLGMKQRLGIAQALLGNPKLLILDEPTNGLDPAGIRELREFIHMLVREKKISVFISSHLLSEVQLICDRVAIIDQGNMITVATIDDLIKKAADRIEWTVTPVEKAEALLRAQGVKEVSVSNMDNRLFCRMSPASVSTYTKMFVEHDIAVHSVKEIVFTLEDLFMELTGGEEHA